jgi:nucleotide-binding universal stress UspA family protein
MKTTAGSIRQKPGFASRQQRGTSRPSDGRNSALKGPVLLATRGSSDSTAATQVAQLLAARIGRQLSVISVVEPVLSYGLPLETQSGAIVIEREMRTARVRDLGGPFAARIGADVKWSSEVVIGNPATEVCHAARAAGATLIVVGASPHRRLRRIVAGQRAAQILHRSETPVLSVAPWLKAPPARIVAAIDFSPASIKAAQAAVLIAAPEAVITLVHVVPVHLIAPAAQGTNTVLHASIATELEKHGTRLRELAQGALRTEAVVLDGDAAAEILNFAEGSDADLIAVGTSADSALRRALVGSVATEIFHTALCSVLASPPPSAQDRLDLDLRLKGTATTDESDEFTALLDGFSKRNTGLSVSLEEDSNEIGAQVQAHGYLLRGVTYDRSARRVDVMLAAEPKGGAHLTRSIPGVSSVSVTADPAGEDSALQIAHGTGQTLVLIDPGARA